MTEVYFKVCRSCGEWVKVDNIGADFYCPNCGNTKDTGGTFVGEVIKNEK